MHSATDLCLLISSVSSSKLVLSSRQVHFIMSLVVDILYEIIRAPDIRISKNMDLVMICLIFNLRELAANR